MKCVWIFVCAAALYAQAVQKNYKSRDEYDLIAEATKSLNASNFSKAIADLEAWAHKYPDSEFKDNRQMLFVDAHYGANDFGKALAAGAGLVGNEAAFDQPADRIRILYKLAVSMQRLADPTEAQLATGSDAARRLAIFDKAPPGASAADWEKARRDLQATAKAALLHAGLVPIARAVKANQCDRAEEQAKKVVQEYPESAQAAWALASASLCAARSQPEKMAPALYSLARAASLDPVKGMVDPRWQQNTVSPLLERLYKQYHGSVEGLAQLKEKAVQSAVPPEGFTIQSAAQIEEKKAAEFESQNPEAALWRKIKAALAATDGMEYFNDKMRDAALPSLKGTLVSAKPACRPAELRVAIDSGEAEVSLKLPKPVTGKPELHREVKWEGIARAFSREPFLVTMDTAKVEGLKLAPCSGSVKK